MPYFPNSGIAHITHHHQPQHKSGHAFLQGARLDHSLLESIACEISRDTTHPYILNLKPNVIFHAQGVIYFIFHCHC